MPKHTAVGASPLIGCKNIEDKLVVWSGSIVGAAGLLYFLIPSDLKSNAFILVALGTKVINEVIVVESVDASHGAMPRSGSQLGVAGMYASPQLLQGDAPVASMEWILLQTPLKFRLNLMRM